MRFKRTATMRVGKKYIHINRKYCLFYSLPFGEYCSQKCSKGKDFPDCNCQLNEFLEFAEKKLGMCTYRK